MTVNIKTDLFEKIMLAVMEVVTGAQIRQSENPEKIREYAEAMAEGWGTFPEIQVCRIGGQYMIADGHHRWKAAQQAGLKKIPCLVVGETEAELWEHAFSENVNKGIVMTDEEKREAYRKAILKFPDKSARELAEMCRCSYKTIERAKNKLENEGVYKRPENIIGKDGVAQKAKHTKITGGTPVPPTPPAAPAGYVTCRICGEKTPKVCAETRDTTWIQKGLDENNRLVWLCSDKCEDAWNEAQAEALEAELDRQNTEPLTAVEMKPPKEPESCILDIRIVCEVKGITDPDEAFAEVQENLPKVLSGSKFQIKKSGIYINNNINSNNNINTNFREEKTEFVFKTRKGKSEVYYTLGKSKLEEYKTNYPTLDVESVMRDCMIWNNDGTGSALVPFQKLYQRINSFLMMRRDQIEKHNGNAKKSKYGIDESALTSWEGY